MTRKLLLIRQKYTHVLNHTHNRHPKKDVVELSTLPQDKVQGEITGEWEGGDPTGPVNQEEAPGRGRQEAHQTRAL